MWNTSRGKKIISSLLRLRMIRRIAKSGASIRPMSRVPPSLTNRENTPKVRKAAANFLLRKTRKVAVAPCLRAALAADDALPHAIGAGGDAGAGVIRAIHAGTADLSRGIPMDRASRIISMGRTRTSTAALPAKAAKNSGINRRPRAVH